MEYTILIVLLPLLTFLVLGLLGMKLKACASGLVGTLSMAVTTALAYGTAWQYFTTAKVDGIYQKWVPFNIEWLRFTDNLHIDLGVLLDPISVMMLVVITTVSLMVHIYSLGYMKGEVGFQRYYAFLSLFTFSMLGLVVATNIFQMYIFWELVGVSSYLLIGFYYTKPEAIAASKKAFIVTRFADLGFLIGILLLSFFTQTFDFGLLTSGDRAIFSQAAGTTFMGASALAWAMALIFIGGAGKSAMFPLHIWLPNAYTVAPAPSSALLSCLLTKTGVFGTIIVSCKLFLHDAAWGQFILILGIITMVLGAVLAVFSVNLKRTLACSSMSQIGFIIIAVGMQGLLGEHNALAASGTLLHFLNHSLFKLLLFLGAGVIFMNLRELNLNKIRGYGKDKPLLKLIFLMPILGIGGIPLWNGYISKTLIHESMVEYIEVLKEAGQSIAFMKGAEILFLFSGGLTLAYMTKIFVCIFLEDNPYGAPKPVKNGPYISRLMAVILGAIAICLPILGIFPHQTQDALAAMGAHFMNAHTPAHAVHYFAWVNLKGAVISICVGIVVYFLFIRKVLMQKDAKGNLVYVDRWPGGSIWKEK